MRLALSTGPVLENLQSASLAQGGRQCLHTIRRIKKRDNMHKKRHAPSSICLAFLACHAWQDTVTLSFVLCNRPMTCLSKIYARVCRCSRAFIIYITRNPKIEPTSCWLRIFTTRSIVLRFGGSTKRAAILVSRECSMNNRVNYLYFLLLVLKRGAYWMYNKEL